MGEVGGTLNSLAVWLQNKQMLMDLFKNQNNNKQATKGQKITFLCSLTFCLQRCTVHLLQG